MELELPIYESNVMHHTPPLRLKLLLDLYGVGVVLCVKH
jgi:hypothetical protein